MSTETKLLYLDDAQKKQCEARVTSISTKNNIASVTLDKTIFYPQGGGQPSDHGVITGKNGVLKVTNVIYNNGNPIHEGKLKGTLEAGDIVSSEIEWNRRYQNMRVHSAGHLVHEAVHELYPDLKPLKGVHGIGHEQYIEYGGTVEISIPKLNVRLAQLIDDDRPIKTEFVSLDELKKRAQFIPQNLPTNKPLRVMEIDGFAPVPDGGTQVQSTKELEGTSITKIEKSGETLKVHYQIPQFAIEKKQEAIIELKDPSVEQPTIEEIHSIRLQAIETITQIHSREDLEKWRLEYLGRKGVINGLLEKIVTLPLEQRVTFGKSVNEAKQAIELALSVQEKSISVTSPKKTHIDPTLPGIPPQIGHLHIVTQAVEEISSIFEKIGFIRVRYPEVDWDWYAFESLNMPKTHPARDEWETFFVDAKPHPKLGKMVLTPHTSNGQVREMERLKGQPPIRMINIAKCYRRQSDVSHAPMFHQFEGLVVDKGISIVHLKGTIDYFVKQFFGPERKFRLRPYHFQFTEPSFEVDVTCDICNGKGCRLCKEGWLELGGSGMVHPNVLKSGNIDQTKYTGFAFGWGVERTYMMKSGVKIDDVRLLYENDIRFLNQF